MFGLCKNGGKRHFLSMYCIKLQLFCSSTATPNLLPEFLVNSLGYSVEEAISVSSKVSYLKPGNNKPDLVLNFFKQIGLDNSQIKMLVSPAPSLLYSDIGNTLEPKVRVLQEFGLSGSDLARVIAKSGSFLRTGLDTVIRPRFEYLRKLLGNDESVAKALNRSPAIFLRCCLDRKMVPNTLFLRNCGCSSLDIKKLFLRNPMILIQKREWLEDIVQRLEKDFSLRGDSRMFWYGVKVLSSLSKSSLEMKLGIFRSFGWSDTDIITMVQRHPLCLSTSEVKLRNALKFFMEELGCESSYVACRPTLLTFSLEKRVFPRIKIWELLKEKQLIKRVPCFYTVIKYSEQEFLAKYALLLRDEIPEVHEFYIGSGK